MTDGNIKADDEKGQSAKRQKREVNFITYITENFEEVY